MINQQLQNYKIVSVLGEGGMANVYLAENLVLGNIVALKLLKEEYVQNSNIRKRFLAEARNLAKMNHPNVIKVTDLIDAGDIVAFVMEYIDGQTLEKLIEDKGVFADSDIKLFLNQMIASVEYIHSQGFIHRDIKPSNFMVTENKEVKLLDFGIAKNLNEGALDYTKTSFSQQMGTPLYMSPEQVKNTDEITSKTDVYSLGVVLWQMVMGKSPYDSKILSLPEIQVAILKEPLPLTNTEWDEVIMNACKKNPLDRIILSLFEERDSTILPDNFRFNKPSRNKVSRKKILIALSSVVTLTILMVSIMNLSKTKNPNRFENDLIKENIKGNVKRITSVEDPRFFKRYDFKPYEKGCTYDEYLEFVDCQNLKVEYDTTSFDKKGNLLYHSYQSINPFGFESSELYYQRYKNTYDSDSNLLEVNKLYSDYKKYKIIRKLFFDDGYLTIDDRSNDGFGLRKLSYDKKGNLISKISYDSKNKPYFKEIYLYNKQNLCVQKTWKGTNSFGSELYFYDAFGIMNKRIQKNDNEQITEKFNSYGDKVYEESANANTEYPNFISYKVYTYVYDDYKNWIERKCISFYGFNNYNLSREVESVKKRKIYYY